MPAVYNSNNIKDIEMKFSLVTENHKMLAINLM